MDPIELAEDMLDAIAAERDATLREQGEAAKRVDEFSAKGDLRSAGEASSELSRHMEAASALSRALRRCQKVLDDAEDALTSGGQDE